MRRLIIAAACTAACNAFAQSSMTLTGIADAGMRSVSNEGRPSNKSLISGGNNTSRIILSGLEDLGGSLSARFHLEHGLLLNSGAQASSVVAQFWDRRSTVSLVSKAWGEIRAGRDFVPPYRNWSPWHNLSKCTALYATASGLSNDGALTLAIPGGSTGMPAGGSSKGYEAGLRHRF